MKGLSKKIVQLRAASGNWEKIMKIVIRREKKCCGETSCSKE